MFDIFDNSNNGWLTKFIWEVDVDGDIIEDEVVEAEAAIVALVLAETANRDRWLLWYHEEKLSKAWILKWSK